MSLLESEGGLAVDVHHLVGEENSDQEGLEDECAVDEVPIEKHLFVFRVQHALILFRTKALASYGSGYLCGEE